MVQSEVGQLSALDHLHPMKLERVLVGLEHQHFNLGFVAILLDQG